MVIHSIEFNLDFHPITLDNFELAKLIFNKFNQGIKQIENRNDSNKVVFISTLKKIQQPLEKIQICRGIYLCVYYNKEKSNNGYRRHRSNNSRCWCITHCHLHSYKTQPMLWSCD